MPTYAIGDVQGCFDALTRLLKHIDYKPVKDELWFAGDLVNRGEDSLSSLRLIKKLVEQDNAKVVLGNHDLHLLAVYAGIGKPKKKDTISDILKADDVDELMDWLRQQPLFYWQKDKNLAMVHAGIPPIWSLQQTQCLSDEVTNTLSSDNWCDFIENMYGNEPDVWNDSLTSHDRIRVIVNYLTRMRVIDHQAKLNLKFKAEPEFAPEGFKPWFDYENTALKNTNLVFGHWAALNGKCTKTNYFALDTGCVWGNKLSALRLEDKRWFCVEA